ncbi:flagellar assembly protein FliH [uncultured Gammaproteobacteria bacterium]
MSTVHKFQFDEDFEPGAPRPQKRAQTVAKPEPPPPPPPPPPAPTFSADQIGQARTQAYQQGEAAGRNAGYQAGKSEAESEIEHMIGQSLARVADGVGRLVTTMDAAQAERRTLPVQLALTIVTKLMPELARRHGLDEVEGLVLACLGDALDEPRLMINVNPNFLQTAKERIVPLVESRGFSGRVVVLADDRVGLADARVEWASGGAERDTSRLLAEIEQTLARLLADAQAG